ncbi:MAG: hybrid sensor histidine kinase/response regulator [Cyanobacteria bacterium J06633_2]
MMNQVELDAIEEEVRLCFVQEDAPEHIAVLERGILLLNQADGNLPIDEFSQDWHAMMRSAHTLKGGAALSQLSELSQLAHLVEDLLQALSDRRVIRPELACQLLMCSIDDMQMLLNQVANGNPSPSSAVLDDFKTFISTGLQSADADSDSSASNLTEEAFLIRTVLEGDFKHCLERGKSQIEDAKTHPEILQILTEIIQECGVLAEVLNLKQLHENIQKIIAALARTPANPPRFAKRILSYLEQERKKNLHEIQSSDSKQPSLSTSEPQSENWPSGQVSSQHDALHRSEQFHDGNNSGHAVDDVDSELDFDLSALSNASTEDSQLQEFLDATKLPDVAEQTGTGQTQQPLELFEEPDRPPAKIDEAMSFEEAGALSLPETDKTVTESELTYTPQAQETSERLSTRILPSPELTMRVPVRRLDELADTVGEMLITYERLTLDQKRLQHTNRDLKQLTRQFYSIRERIQSLYDELLVPGGRQTKRFDEQGGFDPLEMDEFTDLHSVLQDFQELLARIEEGTQDIDVLTQANLDDADHLRQHMGQLRHRLTDARMVPFATLANRFRRPLWDLNQRYEKSVQLSIDGEVTPIDRAVLEHLYEPMLHLVRNAFDHGIEDPKERTAKGKTKSGSIQLSALHQGTQVVITIKDDGRGIDFEKVKHRAEEMGVISSDYATPQQLLQCLFAPGFSTKSRVSELSGRGVGLDVVKAQVENLRGAIQVYSSSGQGTEFKLTIPLTLNIMPLLVCQRLLPDRNHLTLAIPSSHVSEIIDVPRFVDDKQSIHWRGNDIPYMVLEKLMPFSDQQTIKQLSQRPLAFKQESTEPTIAVILSLSQQPVAIGINELLGEQEMVLKTFDSLVTVPRYFPGCTVLPSGQVVLVLAPDPLEDILRQREIVVTSPDEADLNEALYQVQIADSDAQVVKSDLIALPSSHEKPGSSTRLPSDEDRDKSDEVKTISNARRFPRTIMVVDDSVAARRWMVRSLERSGYQVLQCRDGQDALDTLSKGAQCHLVICDIEMPRMNGFQLLSEIRQTPTLKSLPFALLTSRQGDRHRKQATQLGANGYFVKPLGGQQLLLKIDNLVNAGASK